MSKITLTHKDLSKLINEIIKYQLECPSYIFRMAKSEPWRLIQIYNGGGADSTPSWLRWIITGLLWILKPSILIHDIDFTFMVESFEAVNERFRRNNEKLINAKVNWFLRVFYFRQANKLADYLIKTLGQKWESKRWKI